MTTPDKEYLCTYCVMDESICHEEMCHEATKHFILAHPEDFPLSEKYREDIRVSIFGDR